jgi:hypothetical protein
MDNQSLSPSDQADLEGGDQSFLLLDQADHEGGADGSAVPASSSSAAASGGNSTGVGGSAAPSANQATIQTNEGVTPAPGGMNTAVPPLFVQPASLGAPAAGHAVDTLQARETFALASALNSFNFPNLFSPGFSFQAHLPTTGAGTAQSSAMSAATSHGNSAPTSQPIVPAPQLLSGGPTSLSHVDFASISAEELVHRLRQRIPSLDVEAWKALDFDGPTILELSSPASLPGQLTEYFGYSGLIRDRVASAIKLMIINDESVVIDIRKFWGFVPAAALPAVSPAVGQHPDRPIVIGSATPPFPPPTLLDVYSGSHRPVMPPVRVGGSVFSHNAASPIARTSLFTETPANGNPARQADEVSHSFLAELSSTQNYSLDHSMIPGTPASLQVNPAGGMAAAAGSATALGALGNINITLHQPTVQKYNWMILENLDVRATFYQWLKKNRREKIICDAANQRSLASLVSDNVRQDVMRIYNTERNVFDSQSPIYTYAYVTDELLLKILFYRFGPLNARDAVTRLKEQIFSFDDSTTLQERLGPKVRRQTTEFRQSLLDMKYTAKLWPPTNNILTHNVVIDAFLSCFVIEDEIIGPDGRTKVPKCASMQSIRDMIRENKSQKLDVIIDVINKRFDDIDAAVRSDPLLKHNVQPWRTQGKFNARKRKFEHVSSTDTDKPSHSKQAREQGSSEGNPRCANCGSKGHICGERTCYFWGHPKAKGKDGKWPAGTPSLRLEDSEMAEWRGERQEIFYSYPENAHKKNKKTAKGGNHTGKPNNKGISKTKK